MFLGLVVAAGVDGEFAEEFACRCVDDSDVEVVGEDDDVGSGVGSADADVVQSSVDSEGDASGFVDAVAADSFVGVGVACSGRGGFG